MELFAFGEMGVVDAAASFEITDTGDLGDVRFDCSERLVGGIGKKVECFTVERFAPFSRVEFVGDGSGVVGAFASLVGELVDELSEFLFVDVEVLLSRFDESFFEVWCEVEEFVFVGVGPVVGVGGFAPEVEGVVVDGDAEFFLTFSEVEALVEEIFEDSAVGDDGVGNGAEILGSGSVVGFEFGYGETLG